MKVGDVFPSNNYGDMTVIKYKDALNIQVKFHDTGAKKWTSSTHIREGCVRDPSLPLVRNEISTPEDMTVGKVHSTNNFGKLKITKYEHAKKVWYRFLDTGYENFTTSSEIRNGEVGDRLAPNVCGVGYIGVGPYQSNYLSDKNPYIPGTTRSPAYESWAAMLYRCYEKKNYRRQPSYANVEVDKRWHDFQVFAEWYYNQDWRDKELDKDLLVGGEGKLYGPDTCVLLTKEDNTAINRDITVARSSNSTKSDTWRVQFNQTFSDLDTAVAVVVDVQLAVRNTVFAELGMCDPWEDTIGELLAEQARSRVRS
ncbi:hypothetical protein [Photobacterium lipolyticum]|uniref:Uncharacterized protein n=1 Tax=Photobacterium lipolyticum TaxID=266810 RepID=A0A2T3N176_9GAMM|nr:hypothetical protein [Photobacterium lipolyticum]PSW06059.1 hypothetical protein C9I89_05970 [Photobacterium lipolyticum]